MTEYQQGLMEAAKALRDKAAKFDAKRIEAVELGHPRSEARCEKLRDAWLDEAECIERRAQMMSPAPAGAAE